MFPNKKLHFSVPLYHSFFSQIHEQRIIVLSRRRNCYNHSITTQMERTPNVHKPVSQMETTRKINSNPIYSQSTQPKWLALGVALSRCYIPQKESSYPYSSTSEIYPALRPCSAAEFLLLTPVGTKGRHPYNTRTFFFLLPPEPFTSHIRELKLLPSMATQT
jgi:hypothetical protein